MRESLAFEDEATTNVSAKVAKEMGPVPNYSGVNNSQTRVQQLNRHIGKKAAKAGEDEFPTNVSAEGTRYYLLCARCTGRKSIAFED